MEKLALSIYNKCNNAYIYVNYSSSLLFNDSFTRLFLSHYSWEATYNADQQQNDADQKNDGQWYD